MIRIGAIRMEVAFTRRTRHKTFNVIVAFTLLTTSYNKKLKRMKFMEIIKNDQYKLGR